MRRLLLFGWVNRSSLTASEGDGDGTAVGFNLVCYQDMCEQTAVHVITFFLLQVPVKFRLP